MRVVVLGSGVVGVATAYYLTRDGHEVIVVDRQSTAGMETSFANAGQVSPGASTPWAAPGIPVKALKWLAMRYRPLVLWPLLDRRLYGWLAHTLANCTEAAFTRNKSRMLALAEYSRDSLREVRAATGIAYDERTGGTLQLFRKQAQLDAAGHDTAILDRFGVPWELLDVAGCIAREPGLRDSAHLLVGGLRLPGDETGDAHLFTRRLADICREAGASFRFGASVKRLRVEGGRLDGIELARGEVLRADAFVVAAGSYTPSLLRPLGIDVPVYPVKGYSLTAKVADPALAPVSTVMDETYKIAITRLGDRVRIGGTGRARRVQLEAAPAASRDARAFGARPVSARLRPRRRQLLDRTSADDAGRHAARRRDGGREPVREHRSRHAGLDDGLRLGAVPGRPDRGAEAGHRSGRSGAHAICANTLNGRRR